MYKDLPTASEQIHNVVMNTLVIILVVYSALNENSSAEFFLGIGTYCLLASWQSLTVSQPRV